MPYRVVNRHKGFVVLPDGQKLERHNSTKIEDVTPEFKQMESKGLISIHYLIEPTIAIKKHNVSSWESLIKTDLGESQLPTPLHEGMLLFGRGEKFIYSEGRWEHKGFASGKIAVITVDDAPIITVDITGIDIVKFGQDVFDLSPLTGKAKLIARTSDSIQAGEVMNYVYPTGDIFLQMGVVKGRDCRMTVYRREEALLMDLNWDNHSKQDLIELLRRHGIV